MYGPTFTISWFLIFLPARFRPQRLIVELILFIFLDPLPLLICLKIVTDIKNFIRKCTKLQTSVPLNIRHHKWMTSFEKSNKNGFCGLMIGEYFWIFKNWFWIAILVEKVYWWFTVSKKYVTKLDNSVHLIETIQHQ